VRQLKAGKTKQFKEWTDKLPWFLLDIDKYSKLY
jgi:hypothetical protein